MGIRGLVTFCKNNNCYEEYDLVTLAKTNKNLEILVDFCAFVYYICEISLKRLASKYCNDYLLIPGAEYDELINSFREFHLMFANIGIKLVYVVDGPKGLDKDNQRNKETTWNLRMKNNMKVYESYLAYCKNPVGPVKNKIILPYLLSRMYEYVIKSDGAEIINLIYGEADYQIANLRKQRNSWAVLTNDSDYFVFHDCPTIQFDFFDMDKNLVQCYNKKDNKNSVAQPLKLVVGVITDKILMKKLDLSTHDKLIDFSVLMGNDYTADFAKKFRNLCGIVCKQNPLDIADPLSIAKWVRKQPNLLLSNKKFEYFSENNSEYKMSVQFSMDFYKQRLTDPVVEFTSAENEEFWNYLIERYKNVEISNICLSVFHGFCYQINCVEPIVQGTDRDINSLLISLRSKIFSLFLQNGMSSVHEYEVPNSPNYTRLVNVPASSVNLKSFMLSPEIHNPWIYFDENWSTVNFEIGFLQNATKQSWNYFDRFGPEIGFCCYCLRVLWLVTEKTKTDKLSLVLTEPEFRSVFCTVFFRLLRRKCSFSSVPLCSNLIIEYPNCWFYKLKICPSSVCETTQEWLQVIYFLAHTLYGKSLNIAQYFPEAHEFISGTVLTVFFEYAHNNAQRLRRLDSTQIDAIYRMLSTVCIEFKHIYKAILKPF